MWQSEYQSPVHHTSLKLQTLTELKSLKDGIKKTNGKRIITLFLLFKILWTVTFAKPTNQCSATIHVCLGWVCGEVY